MFLVVQMASAQMANYGQNKREFSIPDVETYSRANKAMRACVQSYQDTIGNARGDQPRYVALDVERVITAAKTAGVPEEPLRRALGYVQYNPEAVKNSAFVGVADFSQPALARRFYVVDTESGSVESFMVGQGIGRLRGKFKPQEVFDRFSGAPETFLSGRGCFLTALKPYVGTYGRAYNLHGLTSGNASACRRRTVLHVASARVFQGKSRGCLAIDRRDARTIMARLGRGGIVCTNPL